MRFAGDKIAHFAIGDVGRDFHNGAAELVTHNARGMDAARAPRIPVVDVKVGSAQAGMLDPQAHMARGHARFENINDVQAGFRTRLCDGLHSVDATPLTPLFGVAEGLSARC